MPVEIQGFPTIKLYPAGKKDSPIDYSGSRTVEDLANFIRDNGSHKVDAYTPPAPEPEEAEATEEIIGEAASAASKVGDKVAEEAEKATNTAKKATETAKKATESVKEKAKEAKDAAKEAAADAAEKVQVYYNPH